MRTPSLLGIALLCLSAMPAAMDDVHHNSKKHCDGHHKDWYRTGRYCIQYFNTPLSFSDAESACREEASGSHLVSVHDEQANEDALAIVLKFNPSSPRTWLGGQRVGQSEKFFWTDDSPWNFEKWVPGQPSYTSTTENCVEMNWQNLGEWNDDRCSNHKPFICAFELHHGPED